MDLVSDAAIVTGGAQGIGRGIVAELMAHGVSVAIADVDLEGARETSEELGAVHDAEALAVECDVTDGETVEEAVAVASEEFGTVGILVNNAGGADLARTWEMSEAVWDHAVDVCLKGTFLPTRAVINHMLDAEADRGAIVNVSSLNYTAATDGLAHYSAAKAGVSQFTKAVAGEAGRHGIRVNAVAPGSTRTPATEGGVLAGESGEEFLDRTVLERRFGEPEDVADVVAFLASERAGWITGETICVDGGQHIRGLHSYWDTLEEMGALE